MQLKHPFKLGLLLIVGIVAAIVGGSVFYGFIHRAICPPPTVEEVNRWLHQLPKGSASTQVESLFRAKSIELENCYPADAANGQIYANIHGIIRNVDWMGHDIDISVFVDIDDNIVRTNVTKVWRGP